MNHLANESSLYLQQHAGNPVNWYPWSNEAWEKARNENKLVLISIGYSSCHWCHVMEHETFTDATAAAIMNHDFVCIKVDREERPDIDQTYMAAVQLMTGSGGWPLNCFALPDGRPIYGGTYFPNANWRDVLVKLNEFYKNDPAKANEYADELAKGMAISEKFSPTTPDEFSPALLDEMIAKWKHTLDYVHGGPNRAPKFPMPNNYDFLLRYAIRKSDDGLLDQIKLTLKKMAYGGIYDQIAGGFARYSTDTLWKVPHFEKMLYDNAQLIGLYSKAYKYFKDDLHKNIVYETSDFLFYEMSDQNGGYYSSYDADSEGEEGKYYVWTEVELKHIPLSNVPDGNPYGLLADYYNINSYGNWEHGNYVLIRKENDSTLTAKHQINEQKLKQFITEAKQALLEKRNQRTKPALDKKIITSWNALMISGLCDAYEAFEDELFLNRAKQAADRLLSMCTSESGKLLHVESQKGKIAIGYLEDYAFTITALIRLYECTFEERYILKAKEFTDDAIALFYDSDTSLFWFNSSLDNTLFVRKKEIHDNVIAASNSEMGKACFYISRYFEDEKTETIAKNMMRLVAADMALYGPSYSNWAILYADMVYPFKEVVTTGPDCIQNKRHLSKKFTSGVIFAGGVLRSALPLLKDRISASENTIYVCENKSCKLPVHSLEEVDI